MLLSRHNLVLLGCSIGLLGCNDLSGLSGKQKLPAGVPDPSTLNTPVGAMELYTTALSLLEQTAGSSNTTDADAYLRTAQLSQNGVIVDFMLATGLLSDELSSGDLGGSPAVYPDGVSANTFFMDARQMPEQTLASTTDPAKMATQVYNNLQQMRQFAGLANEALATYDTTANPALRGLMYTIQGYAEVMLGELFCSGVPLSTIDYHGDYTYHAGSTTQAVLQDAVSKFDSALALATDSARTQNLARVGMGRALLDLGAYAQAGQAVAAVPDTFNWSIPILWGTAATRNIFKTGSTPSTSVTVSDREGGSGLPYITDGDPRTAVVTNGSNTYGETQYFPAKYGSPTSTSLMTVANGVEARLIQSEAALRAGDASGWLTQLNDARQLASPTLPSLTDPGTDSARVSLLFQERASDLFLTGHRLGDLRRLIRQYDRDSEALFPTGGYPGFVPAVYGGDVNAPIPRQEYYNPLFTGCLDRGA